MSTVSKILLGAIIGVIAGSLAVIFGQPLTTVPPPSPPERISRVPPDLSTTVIYHVLPEAAYDERTVAHPYNPGPGIILAPIPSTVHDHKNLHLPDPVCLAGCTERKPR